MENSVKQTAPEPGGRAPSPTSVRGHKEPRVRAGGFKEERREKQAAERGSHGHQRNTVGQGKRAAPDQGEQQAGALSGPAGFRLRRVSVALPQRLRNVDAASMQRRYNRRRKPGCRVQAPAER